METGASYETLDKFCESDTTQNKVASDTLYHLLETIYIGTGKVPVFHEDRVEFENTKYPVAALPQFLKFKECPVANIPGHKKDREIFESFYPILTDNMGLYFRVALAWLAESENQRAAVLLHVSNRDFDKIHRLKIYVPVITNMDTRMDIVAMSIEAFIPLMLMSSRGGGSAPCYLRFDPRSGAKTPTLTKELVPSRALEQAEYIKRVQYPEFYEKMLSYVSARRLSSGAYTCGQFLLDLHMRN